MIIAAKYLPILDNKSLSLWTKLYWRHTVVDRFGLLNDKSNANLISSSQIPKPLYEFKYTNLIEIFDLVIQNSIKKANGNLITVFWSGGVDSTALVCGYLKHLKDKKQLIVFCSEDSVKEYPWFYDFLCKNCIKVIKHNSFSFKKHIDFFIQNNCMLSIGWCADQLFGSMLNVNFPELYFQSISKGLKEIYITDKKNLYKRNPVFQSDIDLLIEDIQFYSEHLLNKKLSFMGEVGLLGNFGIKFSHVYYDLYLTLFNYGYEYKNIDIPFSDSRLQDWAILNFEKNTKNCPINNPSVYKKELKDYIYSFTKDEDYLLNKNKVNSWKNNSKAVAKNFVYLNENFEFKKLPISYQFGFDNYILKAEEIKKHDPSIYK